MDVVEKAATDMGLQKQKYTDKWAKLGYITTIRNAWHILPYEQLLALLGWEEEKLATISEDILVRSTNHGVNRYKIMPEFLP